MPPPRAPVEGAWSRRAVIAAGASAIATRATAEANPPLSRPVMRLAHIGRARPAVAVTLDACPGAFDQRIAAALVEGAIPATIFVSAPWMRRNPDGLAFLNAHPDVFSLQNHGAHHDTCVLGERRLWGLTPAGTLDGVRAEVDGGARAIAEATGRRPTWFRGAAALYSPTALDLIRAMGVGVAGYSLNGDVGASLSQAAAVTRIAAAADGDVVICHINQPERPAGAGVAEAVMDLKRQGVRFVRLDALTPNDAVYA
jgi:peptidoglycan/xylan/chitin deacetylase (PgdA/CDA1 family)